MFNNSAMRNSQTSKKTVYTFTPLTEQELSQVGGGLFWDWLSPRIRSSTTPSGGTVYKQGPVPVGYDDPSTLTCHN